VPTRQVAANRREDAARSDNEDPWADPANASDGRTRHVCIADRRRHVIVFIEREQGSGDAVGDHNPRHRLPPTSREKQYPDGPTRDSDDASEALVVVALRPGHSALPIGIRA
jgi:hypothetical protein